MLLTATVAGASGTGTVHEFILRTMPQSVRVSECDTLGHFALPKPYSVPCVQGIFQDLFYWDTYFTNAGLIADNNLEQARNNIECVAAMIDRLGFMPNASRVDMAQRSQPPYFAPMVDDYFRATGDRAFVRRMMPVIEKEYKFWMTERKAPNGLNRYGHNADKAYLLTFFRDVSPRVGINPSGAYSEAERLKMSGHLLAEAESGWDFNARFERRCMDYNPVDLNSLLYLYESLMEEYNRMDGNTIAAGKWNERAVKRKNLMNKLMRDKQGVLRDYDYVNRHLSPIFSAASFMPMWVGMADEAQAKVMAENLGRLESANGLFPCEPGPRDLPYQWDAPNGWSACALTAVQALDRYGYTADADRLADKYMRSIEKIYDETGQLWEKYNAEEGSVNVTDEYKMPGDFMGWTAGVYSAFLDRKNKAATRRAYGEKDVEKYKQICRENIQKVKNQMYREPRGRLKYPFIVPGSESYLESLWDWDSWLSDIALRQILLDSGSEQEKQVCMEHEKGCISNWLDYCGSEGFVPITITPNHPSRQELLQAGNIYEQNIHKPCLAQHVAFIIRNNGGDAEWIRNDLLKLSFFINHYMQYKRDKSTGLMFWNDDTMIGVDNDPSTFYRPRNSSASIFLNVMMYKELQAMAYICRQLKMEDAAKSYEKDADELKACIDRHCWDPRDGFYYSCDLNLLPVSKPSHSGFTLHQGSPRNYDCLLQRFSVWSGFLPMWAGMASPEQAEEMVTRNYRNKDLFNSPWGVYTLSPQEKMFNVRPSGNPSSWQGPIWICANWFVWRGLVNYGYLDDARELAEKTVVLLGRDFERFGNLHEYYDPFSGEPVLNLGFTNWNLLVLNMIAWLDGKECVNEF